MALVRPFSALRPRPDLAEWVASVPYDVVSTPEARDLAAGNPHSFLHVVRPEIDLPVDTDPYHDSVYAQAKAGLERLKEEGTLVRDEEPALYIYRQVMGGHSQVGVVGCCSVDEYDQDLIKKHERTRPDKEDDRTRHVVTLRAHAGPVFLTYPGRADIDAQVSRVMEEVPLYDFTAEDGVAHTVWRTSATDGITEAFSAVEALYVADGHHRSASASRTRAQMREEFGSGAWDHFLAVLFPADQLRIMAYNRVVHDLAGLDSNAFLAAVSGCMVVSEGGEPSPPEKGSFSMYFDGRWYGLRAPGSALAVEDPVARLDAAILQSQVLGPILGIEDPRTSKRIDFVGGIRGTDELVHRVDDRPGSVAFSLYPLGVDELIDVSDAGAVLPPKSTWFEPKLRSGLLVHEF